MITLGDTDYTLSQEVVVHELAHHWYGDTVTPADWRDVWMNEGMATYLQGMWEAEDEGVTIDEKMDQWAGFEAELREKSGPPADYDPASSVTATLLLPRADVARAAPADRRRRVLRGCCASGRPTRRTTPPTGRSTCSWIEAETGEELCAFFDDWLLGETTPPRD